MTRSNFNTGILVIGYAREKLLKQVLDSLKIQDALASVHIWLDGTGGRQEFGNKNQACRELVIQYSVAEVVNHTGHLGIEKLMLDALTEMQNSYERIIILEDDCFPTHNAIGIFQNELDLIEEIPNIYSVYGHHFLVPSEGETISRFQGWGWATTRDKLRPILDQLKHCFMMSEKDYLRWVSQQLDDTVKARLDVTPGRDVLNVLGKMYSWDSCTALLTAKAGLLHKKTTIRTIYNCGIGNNSGHFPQLELFSDPPFNMISSEDVWSFF
jgi:hypothetical protein